jgi:hypothetical protein
VNAGPKIRPAADRARIPLSMTRVVRSASQIAVVSTARNRSSSSSLTGIGPAFHLGAGPHADGTS